MAQRPAVLAALGIATIGGYYLYQAGGSPKVAEKKMEGKNTSRGQSAIQFTNRPSS